MKKLLLILFLISTSSCATVVSKSVYQVSVNSSPEGANFEVKNTVGIPIVSGTTPSVISLPASSGFLSGENYSISFSKVGYTQAVFGLSSSVDLWVLGNFFLGFFPLIIDAATGAMYKLPSGIFFNLSPVE